MKYRYWYFIEICLSVKWYSSILSAKGRGYYDFSFATTKGGGAKTTTTICLATHWASRGYRVGIIDTDRTQALTSFFAKATAKQRLPEVMPNLTVIHEAGDEALVEAARQLEQQGHQIVLIDLAGSASKTTVYAIGIARLVIIPSGPGGADVDEAIKTALTVRTTSKMVQRDIPHYVSLNRVKKRTEVGRHALKQFEKQQIPILDQTIAHSVAFDEMFYSQRPPNIANPVGMAAVQLRSLAREIECLIADFPQLATAAAPPPQAQSTKSSSTDPGAVERPNAREWVDRLRLKI